ncbi:uncharacterized protein KRP23_2886 [Phytophthora ramorum]|uniref:uncharacterized protein n=1 Tax=Phytophthora ramorum TaxID=164328 RepID=UPI0030A8CB0C|nr:hypothetical protein KRP23_2886 [Phytophthora ramorum]
MYPCWCSRCRNPWFLRDGVLPLDPMLLRDLHMESEIWRFESLLQVVEGDNHRQQGQDNAFEHLPERRSSMNAKSKPKAKKSSEDDNGETETWWKD